MNEEQKKLLEEKYKALGSGVGFNSKYDVYGLSPEARQEQYVAEELQAITEKVDSGEPLDLANDMEMMARAFVDGLWLNKSEEIGSYLGAVAVKVFNPELARGLSVADIAKEMEGNLEAESSAYAEANPWKAGVANVAGAVLSPVSLAGGQVLSQAAKLRGASQAASAGDEVAAALGGRFASQGDDLARMRQMYGQDQFGQLASIVSRSPTPVAASSLAATEGAVVGFEGENTQEKIKNSAVTAGISATVPFAFAGAKKVYDFATESKMAQQLGEGADFINLMFTEHGVSQWYRNVVSKAYGGRSLSEQQARRVASRALTPAAARKAASEIKADAENKVKRATSFIKTSEKEAVDEINFLIDDNIRAVKAGLSEATGNSRMQLEEELKFLEEAKIDERAKKLFAVKQADAEVSAVHSSFRGQALRESAPAGATADEINSLGAMDIQDANVALDELWKKYGFKVANGKSYKVDLETVESFIDLAAKNFPELSLIGGELGGIVPKITNYITEELSSRASNGVISGADLVQLRSNIGRAINSLSDDSFSTRRFANEIQEYFDDLLESGLSKKESEAFARDRASWAVRSTVDSAIATASGRSARGGVFTPEDYLGAAQQYSSRLAARGKLALQQEAQDAARMAEQNKKNIIELAEGEAGEIAKDVLKQKAQAKASLQRQIQEIKKQQQQEISALEKQRISDVNKATEKARIAQLKEAKKQEHRVQLAALEEKLTQAKAETEAMKNMMPSTFKGSVFENLFNTAIQGQVTLFATPAASESIKATLATGALSSRLLAQEYTQRVLARQSKSQEAVRRYASAAGDALQSVGVTPSQTTGGQVAAIAQGTTEQGLSFSEDRKALIRQLPSAGKAALYKNLEANGRLDVLRTEDPKLFNELKKAANK